eukprot:TRINITY_DN21541_c0_g1_i1.p1 TRINITY_DN21541_c0_g1~~TRINITY_DN21541_c0_g1_i1.p1  ORF type:complete len:547 (+),score=96.16 TRINITY_DN21541_c0_g1_i1:77-1717(+)
MQKHSDSADSSTSPRGRTQCLIKLPKLPRIVCQGKQPREDDESSSLTERLLPRADTDSQDRREKAAHTIQVRAPTTSLPWTTSDACSNPMLESLVGFKSKLAASDNRTEALVKASRSQVTSIPGVKKQPLAETITLSDLEAAADMPKKNRITLDPQHLHCLQMCCARLSCSWFCKMFVLVLAVNMFFVVGSLSQPIWIPISLHKACQTSDDNGGGPKPILAKAGMAQGLHACESLCSSTEGCQAVDWFNETQWCNLYTEPCAQPTAEYSGSSSYQMAISCSFRNGSAGVLLDGHCHVGIEVPTVWSIVKREVPVMLSSPRSWAISLGIALLYTYIVSAWCRQKMQPVSCIVFAPVRLCYRWFWAGGCWRRFATAPILLGVWCSYTFWEWGAPQIQASSQGMMKLPLAEWAWLGGSSTVLAMVLCPSVRGLIFSMILGIGTWIMTAFTGLMTFALSACFDVGALGAAGVAGGVGVADAAATLDGVVAADVAAGAEGAAAADATAAAGATAEASAAADAAIAAEAAAAAEAVTAAEGAATIAVLCSIQ